MLCLFLLYSKVIVYIHSFHVLFHYGLLQDIEYSSHAIQEDLIVYLFYIYQFVVYLLYILFCIYQLVSTNPNSHSVPLLCSLPLGNHKSVVQVCESVAVLQLSSFVSYFRIHIQVVLGGIRLSLSDLTSFSIIISRSIHVVKALFHCFFWLSCISLCICTTSSSPFISQWTFRLSPCLSGCKQCCYEQRGSCCCFLVLQSCLTLCDPMDYSPLDSSVHGDSPGKNTRVGCHALLQGIFQTQESNPGLPHCRQILYYLSHQGRPGAYIFSNYSFYMNICPGVGLVDHITIYFQFFKLLLLFNSGPVQSWHTIVSLIFISD